MMETKLASPALVDRGRQKHNSIKMVSQAGRFFHGRAAWRQMTVELLAIHDGSQQGFKL